MRNSSSEAVEGLRQSGTTVDYFIGSQFGNAMP
jgi:hypothetical protein